MLNGSPWPHNPSDPEHFKWGNNLFSAVCAECRHSQNRTNAYLTALSGLVSEQPTFLFLSIIAFLSLLIAGKECTSTNKFSSDTYVMILLWFPMQLCACEALGSHVLRRIQVGAVTSVWSIVCIQLMRMLWAGRWELPLASLVQDVSWLITVLQKIGADIAVEGMTICSPYTALSNHLPIVAQHEDSMFLVFHLHWTSLLIWN